jgi:hypothetical protein
MWQTSQSASPVMAHRPPSRILASSMKDLMYDVGCTLLDKALLLEVEGRSAELLPESLIVVTLCVPSTKVSFYLKIETS